MPQAKNLHQQIENKLDQLAKLLDQIDEARLVNSDKPTTWDSDLLYKLVANLKATLKLLENKVHPKAKDPWGEPLILATGLCSLVDEYHNEDYD